MFRFLEKMESCKKNKYFLGNIFFLDFAKIGQQVCVKNFRVSMIDLHFIRIFFFFFCLTLLFTIRLTEFMQKRNGDKILCASNECGIERIIIWKSNLNWKDIWIVRCCLLGVVSNKHLSTDYRLISFS